MDNGDIVISSMINYNFYGSFGSLIRVDSLGNLVWAKTYNEYGNCLLFRLSKTLDGNIISIGCYDKTGTGNYDVLLIKTNNMGNVLWAKTYGGSYYDYGTGIGFSSEGEILLTGDTESYGFGAKDVFLIKADSSGNLLWAKTYGGSYNDVSNGQVNIIINDDNTYFIRGGTSSFGPGNDDFYLIKTDSFGSSGCNEQSFTPSVNPFTATINQPYIFVSSGGAGTGNANTIVNDISLTENILCIDTITTVYEVNNRWSNFDITISPNPFNDFTTLYLENTGIKDIIVEVHNLLGERVMEILITEAREVQINMRKMDPGVYFLNVFSKNRILIKSEKFIKR